MKLTAPPIRCVPPVWAQGGHQQTLLGHLIPSLGFDSYGAEPVEIPLEDGDLLAGTYLPGRSGDLIVLFHGLCADVSADYMRRSARVARLIGHAVLLVNHRGCGAGKGKARGIYHTGRAEDLSAAILFARRRWKPNRVLAAGFSLSANALLLLLTGRRGTEKPDFAIAVNGPIHVDSSSEALKHGWNRIYDTRFYLLSRKSAAARARAGHAAGKVKLPLLTHLREFDELYTAREGGFRNRADYYESCSTFGHLDRIEVPTVLLTAKDDPFIDYRKYEEAKLSPAIHLHIEEFGGHIGYLTRAGARGLGYERWLDYAMEHYFQQLLLA